MRAVAARVVAADAEETDFLINHGDQDKADEVEVKTASAAVGHSDEGVYRTVVDPRHRTVVVPGVEAVHEDHH